MCPGTAPQEPAPLPISQGLSKLQALLLLSCAIQERLQAMPLLQPSSTSPAQPVQAPQLCKKV